MFDAYFGKVPSSDELSRSVGGHDTKIYKTMN